MMKPTLIMMSGLPGSGKSTVAEELSQKINAHIHSSDEIRKELFNDENEQSNNSEVFNELHRRVIDDLKSGQNVIYDACNINYKRRMAFLSLLSANKVICDKSIYVIATTYEDCLLNNSKRERCVPEYVIKSMYQNFYLPYYYEGWDSISIVYPQKNTPTTIDTLFSDKEKGLDFIKQDNPHHKYTVGIHCRMAAQHLLQNNSSVDNVLYEAAFLHDIGKPFTKTFTKQDGTFDNIAHYYQHHLVSAYKSLFVQSLYDVDILKRAVIIQWHMQPFFYDNEKTKDKYKKLLGDDIFNSVELLHLSDIVASGTNF